MTRRPYSILLATSAVLLAVSSIGRPTHAQEPARVWTDSRGNTINAKFVRVFNGAVILNRRGVVMKVPLSQLSAADRDYIDGSLNGRPDDEGTETNTSPADGTTDPEHSPPVPARNGRDAEGESRSDSRDTPGNYIVLKGDPIRYSFGRQIGGGPETIPVRHAYQEGAVWYVTFINGTTERYNSSQVLRVNLPHLPSTFVASPDDPTYLHLRAIGDVKTTMTYNTFLNKTGEYNRALEAAGIWRSAFGAAALMGQKVSAPLTRTEFFKYRAPTREKFETSQEYNNRINDLYAEEIGRYERALAELANLFPPGLFWIIDLPASTGSYDADGQFFDSIFINRLFDLKHVQMPIEAAKEMDQLEDMLRGAVLVKYDADGLLRCGNYLSVEHCVAFSALLRFSFSEFHWMRFTRCSGSQGCEAA